MISTTALNAKMATQLYICYILPKERHAQKAKPVKVLAQNNSVLIQNPIQVANNTQEHRNIPHKSVT